MALKKLQNQYKFYLAFENSNCYGYVTEKFFKTLGKGLVPIVMGGSKNYEKIAPPNSYINVDDYKSPQVWLIQFWAFEIGDGKFNRYLHKYQHTQRKYFVNRKNGELSKMGQIFTKQSFLM